VRPSANSSNGSAYASRERPGDQARNSISGLGSVTLIGRCALARAYAYSSTVIIRARRILSVTETGIVNTLCSEPSSS